MPSESSGKTTGRGGRRRRGSLGYDVEDVDLVPLPAEVGKRPVDHVLGLRGPVDGKEHLTQRRRALLARVRVPRVFFFPLGEGEEERFVGQRRARAVCDSSNRRNVYRVL